MEFVTVLRTFNLAEAQLAGSRLAAADLHPFLKDEFSAMLMEGYSASVGGVKVQVPEDEAETARELLAV